MFNGNEKLLIRNLITKKYFSTKFSVIHKFLSGNSDIQILTPLGWNNFNSIFKLKSENIIKLYFSNKKTLTCTNDSILKISLDEQVVSQDAIGQEIYIQGDKKTLCLNYKTMGGSYVYNIEGLKNSDSFYLGEDKYLVKSI
jgi:hypothetical protein